MVISSFQGRGVGFGFGAGCRFGLGWGFGGGCGIGLALSWGFRFTYGTPYVKSKPEFQGIDYDKIKAENDRQSKLISKSE